MESLAKLLLVVGLLASGKSTIVEVFEENGASVIKADDFFASLVYREEHRTRLMGVFGADVLLPDGKANRDLLRSLLFSLDPEENVRCRRREKALFEEFGDEFFDALRKEIEERAVEPKVQAVVVESATALSRGYHTRIPHDSVVSIHCGWETRLERAHLRSPHIPIEFIKAIMAAQPTDEDHHEMSEKIGAKSLSAVSDIDTVRSNAKILFYQVMGGCWQP